MSQKKINKFEYGYLKGDKKMWDIQGAAYNVVYAWCRKRGYGGFGDPTDAGKQVMKEYEQV